MHKKNGLSRDKLFFYIRLELYPLSSTLFKNKPPNFRQFITVEPFKIDNLFL